ncbi:peroxidase [Streptomyces sp. NBC_00249]|uniref:peroxidase n=1 Tax=Streptomyces sp. NBC_00249 TaxID=2975690 RepID=UPI002256ECDF|nr:peroxidase [Streptomyces sp. NBC_00249]MCX5197738.1 peroxidase [Streptomyces sp. NBC_00249]
MDAVQQSAPAASAPARRTVLKAGAGTAAALAMCPHAAAAAAVAPAAAPAAAPVRAAADGPDLPLRTDRSTQGDILAGSRKDQACLLLLHFSDPAAARRWLGKLLPELSTTEEMARFNAAFSAARLKAGGADPATLSATWTGLSLTYPGLRFLAGRDPFPAVPPGSTAEAFVQGAAQRAEALGDTGSSAPDSWLFGAEQAEPAGRTVHVVLSLSADDPAKLAAAVTRHRKALAAATGVVVFRQDAATLAGALRGHEHFGFTDGISQPGVRGFHAPDPGTGTTVQGKPGTRLVPAGEFLVGQEKAGHRPAGLPAWATGGSFQVVRRLAQDVPGWWAQVRLRLAELKKSGAAPDGATDTWMASRLVGRWPGGTPVAGCPLAERPGPVGQDPDAALTYADDPQGWNTPLFAHIRKGNPRDGLNLAPGRPPLAPDALDGHRIIRRGIPFGPAYDPQAGAGRGADVPRGLVFIGYQADLVEQFEFIAKRWINEGDFPAGRNPRVGADPVLGPDSPVTFENRSDSGSRATTLRFGRFVRTEGALYAFTPSLPALRALADGDLDDSVEVHPATVLRVGDVLDAGSVRLTLGADGDLVILDREGSRLWNAGTAGTGHDARFDSDGELTVRDAAGRTVWSSGTEGHRGARLLVRPQGDVVILDGDREIWRPLDAVRAHRG